VPREPPAPRRWAAIAYIADKLAIAARPPAAQASVQQCVRNVILKAQQRTKRESSSSSV